MLPGLDKAGRGIGIGGFPFRQSMSRGATTFHISSLVTGLVTVNCNIGSGVVNLEDLTFSSVDDFLSTLPFCFMPC